MLCQSLSKQFKHINSFHPLTFVYGRNSIIINSKVNKGRYRDNKHAQRQISSNLCCRDWKSGRLALDPWFLPTWKCYYNWSLSFFIITLFICWQLGCICQRFRKKDFHFPCIVFWWCISFTEVQNSDCISSAILEKGLALCIDLYKFSYLFTLTLSNSWPHSLENWGK